MNIVRSKRDFSVSWTAFIKNTYQNFSNLDPYDQSATSACNNAQLSPFSLEASVSALRRQGLSAPLGRSKTGYETKLSFDSQPSMEQKPGFKDDQWGAYEWGVKTLCPVAVSGAVW